MERNTDLEARIKAIPDGPEKEELLLQLEKDKAEEARKLKEEADRKARAEYDLRVRAVVETALAYWRRGEAQQYESLDLINASSEAGDIGVRRATDHVSPEDATMDTPSYFVCSTFGYTVYYEAIGFQLCGHERSCQCRRQLRLGDVSVVYHWMENCGESIQDAIPIIRSLLRPGDLLTTKRRTGHCMVFLGDCFGDGTEYICHSWGKKYNMETGKESHEDIGTIRLQPVDQLCFTEGNKEWYKETQTPRWSMYDDSRDIIILRPLRVATEENYPLTPNARARLAHPGLNINRVATPGAYRSVPRGSTITYTLTVENHSKNDYTSLPVRENIPAGTILSGDCGAQIENGQLKWQLDIPAGSSKTICYCVTVAENAGTQIVSEGGSVAGIRSNRIVTLVGANLTDDENSKLLALAQNSGTYQGQELKDLAFPCRVYAEVLNQPLNLPDAKTFIADLLEPTTGKGATGPLVRQKAACSMILPRYLGGRMLVTERSADRILEFSLKYLQPGDILLYVKDPLSEQQTEKVYLYLGEGAFGYMTEDGMAVTREDVLWQAYREDVFFCLRPTLIM